MKKGILFLQILALTTAAGTAFAEEDKSPTGKLQIGDTEWVNIQSPRPYSGAVAEGQIVWSHTIQRPGATFIRVHFSAQSAIGGQDYVVVRDGRGKIVKTYRNDRLTDRWSRTAFGDSVTIELVAGRNGGGPGIQIDQIGLGTGPLIEQVDGSVAGDCNCTCYEICQATDLTHIRGSDPVARLQWIDDCGGIFVCSGWLFTPHGHLMTNAHCANSSSEAGNLEVWFNYMGTSCDVNGRSNPDIYDDENAFDSKRCDLDYAIHLVHDPVKGNPANLYGFLPINRTTPANATELWLPQHPAGCTKRIDEGCVVNDNTEPGVNFCSDPPTCPNTFSGAGSVDLSFNCAIAGGSSGSPVLNLNDEVVAIAHASNQSENFGVRMSNIGPTLPNFPMSLTIVGPDALNEGSSSLYAANVIYLSGILINAADRCTWTVNPPTAGTIDSVGLFTVGEVSADTVVSLSAVFVTAGVTVQDTHFVLIRNAASAGSISGSTPPNNAIDARQPSSLDGSNPVGWDSVQLTFTGNVAALTDADFLIGEQTAGSGPPSISSVVILDAQLVQLNFNQPITPGVWTTITHVDSGTQVRLGYLPGDVSGDKFSGAPDILSLIDSLNGIGSPLPIWSTDADRSGAPGAPDIIRIIDLLNGASGFDPWLGATLP